MGVLRDDFNAEWVLHVERTKWFNSLWDCVFFCVILDSGVSIFFYMVNSVVVWFGNYFCFGFFSEIVLFLIECVLICRAIAIWYDLGTLLSVVLFYFFAISDYLLSYFWILFNNFFFIFAKKHTVVATLLSSHLYQDDWVNLPLFVFFLPALKIKCFNFCFRAGTVRETEFSVISS